jgi:hypothetical protein
VSVKKTKFFLPGGVVRHAYWSVFVEKKRSVDGGSKPTAATPVAGGAEIDGSLPAGR